MFPSRIIVDLSPDAIVQITIGQTTMDGAGASSNP